MSAEELINIIAKEHSRTSCSDDNISNGFFLELDGTTISNEYDVGCTRCALLQIANGQATDTHKKITNVIFDLF